MEQLVARQVHILKVVGSSPTPALRVAQVANCEFKVLLRRPYFNNYHRSDNVVRLTQQEYEQKVFNCVGDKYTVISKYQGRSQPITLKCNIHEVTFTCTADCFMRGPKDVRSSCPECSKEKRTSNRTIIICDYCGKEFFRSPSKIQNSKSGL